MTICVAALRANKVPFSNLAALFDEVDGAYRAVFLHGIREAQKVQARVVVEPRALEAVSKLVTASFL